MALYLIQNFESLDHGCRRKILGSIHALVSQEEELLQQAVKGQAQSYQDQVVICFKERNFDDLTQIFDSTTEMAGVLLHIKASFSIPSLKNESATLARTLLPLLNACVNFDFIDENDHQTMVTFL